MIVIYNDINECADCEFEFEMHISASILTDFRPDTYKEIKRYEWEQGTFGNWGW